MTNLTNTTEQISANKNFDKGYKWLHWSMAVLVILMFFATFGFAGVQNVSEHKEMLVGHSSLGTLIALLIILRVQKRFIKKDPTPVQDIARWQQLASKRVQLALYFLMLFMPITGYLTANFHDLPVMVFGAFNLRQSAELGYDEEGFAMLRQIHELGSKLFMLLLVLHVGAAIYHRAVKKDGVLASMTKVKNI